jgi:hypothetical protein
MSATRNFFAMARTSASWIGSATSKVSRYCGAT